MTKSSHDFGADILAENKEERIYIQTKLYLQQKINLKAIQEAYTAKTFYKCSKVVVITNAKFSKSAFVSATKTNVELIGRKRLKN